MKGLRGINATTLGGSTHTHDGPQWHSHRSRADHPCYRGHCYLLSLLTTLFQSRHGSWVKLPGSLDNITGTFTMSICCMRSLWWLYMYHSPGDWIWLALGAVTQPMEHLSGFLSALRMWECVAVRSWKGCPKPFTIEPATFFVFWKTVSGHPL